MIRRGGDWYGVRLFVCGWFGTTRGLLSLPEVPPTVPKVGVVAVRVCKLCRQPFDLDYSFGRPREHCFRCVPAGFKPVRLRSGRVKLRRVYPASRAVRAA